MTLAIKIDNRIQERRREQTQSARPLSQRSSNYVPCPRRAPYQPRWHAMSTLTDLRALPNVIVSHAGTTQDVSDNPNKPTSFNRKSTLSVQN
ncbi:hypothetical protein BASA81_013700 [Batrachochytrium salamandrivorans]|nr:hypothetical protein BASA81_013700 [Batrachochytrium salamandrivorans]